MAKAKKAALPEGVTSYRSRAIRELGHDLFFACNHPLVGTVLPGRGGGTITGCVTPSKKHPKELQLNVGLPNVGRPFRLSTVRDRLRGKTAFGAAQGDLEDMKLATLEAVERFRVDAFPAPVGRVHPGRKSSSRCDPSHPVWSGYDDAVFDAEEEAAARFDDPESVPPREFREAQRAALLRQNPARFNQWDEVTRACVASYEAKYPRAKGYESPQAEVARRRAAFLRAGGDVGHGDWTDQLADATKAAKERKRPSKKGTRSRAKTSSASSSSKRAKGGAR